MESGDGDDYLEFSDYSVFYVLPHELAIAIFGHLTVRDLCWRVSRVCKQWNALASDGRLWRDLYARQWPNLPDALRSRLPDYALYQAHSYKLRHQPHQRKWRSNSIEAESVSSACMMSPRALARSLPTIEVLGVREGDSEAKKALAVSTPAAVLLMAASQTRINEKEVMISGSSQNIISHADAEEEQEEESGASGDDSGDEGDDSGDEGSELCSEDEGIVQRTRCHLSGDELDISPRLVRANSKNIVDDTCKLVSSPLLPASSSSSSSPVPTTVALPSLVKDRSDDETLSEEEFINSDDEETTGTFECLSDSSAPSSPAVSPSSRSSPPLSASSHPSSPLSITAKSQLTRSDSQCKAWDDGIDWRKSYAERMRKRKCWMGKPGYVATLRGHTLAIMSVIVNGKEAASCSLDGTIRTWDLDKRRCTGVFTGHTDWVNSIDYDFSKPNLDVVVSGSYDTSVRLWDTKSKKCKRVLWGHQNIVWSVQLSGNRVVSCSSDATIRIWDVEAGVSIQTLTGHEAAIYCCQYDPARNVVVTGSMDKSIRYWDLNSAGNSKSGCVGILRGHSDRLCCMQEDPKENLLVTGSRDSTIRLWDTRVLETSQSTRNYKEGVADSKACFRVLRGHEGRVCCLQFDEDKIVSGSDDNTVKVWSLHGKTTMSKRGEPSYCINTFTAHDYWVNSLKFRDNMLISGAADDTIKIWDFTPRQKATNVKKSGGFWYADVVSSRPQQSYITNPITSACVLM